MRVKIKGQKWVDPSETPVAIELTQGERAEIAGAPRNQSLFVFGEKDPVPKWALEQNPPPEPAPKPAPKTEVASKPQAAPKSKPRKPKSRK